MQSFPGYKKISKTKLDRAGLWGYSKLRQESILFSFLFYCWIFQRREDKKYPQIFEERWRKCIFVSVERESEARLNFLLFFVLLPWFFIIIIFFCCFCDYWCVRGKILWVGLLWLLMSKKRTTSQARGWKSTPIKCINMKSS